MAAAGMRRAAAMRPAARMVFDVFHWFSPVIAKGSTDAGRDPRQRLRLFSFS